MPVVDAVPHVAVELLERANIETGQSGLIESREGVQPRRVRVEHRLGVTLPPPIRFRDRGLRGSQQAERQQGGGQEFRDCVHEFAASFRSISPIGHTQSRRVGPDTVMMVASVRSNRVRRAR